MQRGAMLAVQEAKALTIEHEPTGRALTQFKPEEVRSDLSKIDVLVSYGVKLRDENKLRELAIAKLETLVDIIDWWEQNVYAVGHNPATQANLDRQNGTTREFTREKHRITEQKALETLGYSPGSVAVVSGWRKLVKAAQVDTDATVARLVEGWLRRAGIIYQEPKEKPAVDRDIQVESIFRAYTKLDPDQRIELKQRIMDFEKSYKDPFAPKAA